MHFFTLPEDSVMVRKIKPQRTQRAQRVVIFIFRTLCVLCVLCGFPKNPISKISKVSGVLVTATRDNASVDDRVLTKDPNFIASGSIETDDERCSLDSRRLERLSLAGDDRLKFYVHANGLYVTFIFLESKFALVM
jgi:hypothetical protein